MPNPIRSIQINTPLSETTTHAYYYGLSGRGYDNHRRTCKGEALEISMASLGGFILPTYIVGEPLFTSVIAIIII